MPVEALLMRMPKKAVPLIQSWNHFRSVQTVPYFSENPDWRASSLPPLPEWLGISRLVTSGDLGYFHSALLFTFNSNMGSPAPPASTPKKQRSRARSAWQEDDEDDEDESAEAVIYTPHGIHSSSHDLDLVASASPPIRTLAFLHGLEYITLGAVPLNLGAHNGLQAQRILRARYWVGTHDEDKKGTGLVGWFLRRKKISVKDAVREERNRRKLDKTQERVQGLSSPTKELLGTFDDVNWVDLGNGESLMLV